MGSILHALQGAKAELALERSAQGKARLCATYVKIIGQELIGTVFLAPYGYRTWNLHRSLPAPPSLVGALDATSSVYLLKDQRYGRSERNVMDVYLPRKAVNTEAESVADLPVAIFCHGGIWTTGAKWQFAPMAASLASRGIVTCVLQYTLYPQAHVPQMVEEVSEATAWVSATCKEYRGSNKKICLIGHSAGAQLCLMALLSLVNSAKQSTEKRQRLPAKVIGLAGAYDIGMHYAYEEGRGVAFLSTMARAMGGQKVFASQSPAVVFNAIADAQGVRRGKQSVAAGQMRSAGGSVPDGSIIGSSLSASPENAKCTTNEVQERRSEGSGLEPSLTLEDLRGLPDIVLMSSKSDVTVPWQQSVEMHEAIRRCKCGSSHLVYDNVGHGDFVIDWQFGERQDRPPQTFANDLVKIILDEQ